MPTPKFLRNLSSKDSAENVPNESPDTTLATRTGDVPPGKTDPNVPQYSDAIKEVWSAVNAELPRAQGVEKFLNSVGTLIMSVSSAVEC
jgi:hypothetical protein